MGETSVAFAAASLWSISRGRILRNNKTVKPRFSTYVPTLRRRLEPRSRNVSVTDIFTEGGGGR
jgi:hypothetical protein